MFQSVFDDEYTADLIVDATSWVDAGDFITFEKDARFVAAVRTARVLLVMAVSA